MPDDAAAVALFRNNLQSVRQRIDNACQHAGRDVSDVQMIAVTKYVNADVTALMVKAGANVLGENRPQVLEEKFDTLADNQIAWHMIGSLQTNKVKKVVGRAELIHSVDSTRLAKAIQKQALAQNSNQRILLEVNVSGDATKHGLPPAEVASTLEHCLGCDHVRVDGFMAMAGLTSNDDDVRRQFAMLREIRDELASRFADDRHPLGQLSMGMSGDFEIAIGEGATLVRVGSNLFEGFPLK